MKRACLIVNKITYEQNHASSIRPLKINFVRMKHFLTLAFVAIFFNIYSQNKKETMVIIETNLGKMKVKLYNETPKHRDNFIKLVNLGYYNGLLFHRVIKDFMIQAGDPKSKNATPDVQLGGGGPGYTIPAEFNPELIHKKGALAAARLGENMNPLRASSGSQFYIVQGKITSDAVLDQIEPSIDNTITNQRIMEYLSKPENKAQREELSKYSKENDRHKLDSLFNKLGAKLNPRANGQSGFKYTAEQRNIYKTIGGTPHLDMGYTVFGEIVEGMDVVDKIAAVKTVAANRPEAQVKIISIAIVK
jgi:peptidylprolyl isomerase